MHRALLLSLLVLACRPAEEPAPPMPVQPPPQAQRCVPAADRLCPVDEGASEPSFAAFRERLLKALREKNEAELMTMIDPNIRTSFGDGGGIGDFRAMWKLPSAESPLWAELTAIVGQGGAFVEGGGFWAPYVYAKWPETYDAFEHVAAVRAGVPLFQRPEESAPRVTTVDYAILKVVEPARPDAAWRHVQTLDGKQGWVRASDARSPIGYRAGFGKRSGAWKMDALVAGD